MPEVFCSIFAHKESEDWFKEDIGNDGNNETFIMEAVECAWVVTCESGVCGDVGGCG